MNRRRWFALYIVAALAAVALMLRGAPRVVAVQEKGPPRRAMVYVYPEKLTAKDKLSFGPSTQQKQTIPIKGDTTLIYVDLMPDARFGHPTQCILISTEGARVVKGDWWLILNGTDLFRNGKDFKVTFPLDLSGK